MESSLILRIKGKLRRYPLLFNLYAFYIVSKRKLLLHRWHLKFGKKYAKHIYKPVLSYLEIDIVSHCNLKCNGCSHFSPLANHWFADVEEYDRDMRRLGSMFSNIQAIRILGGEPLLHPEIVKFLYITREIFKNARISIATNGVLLHTMKEEFWEACRKNQIKLNWSVYPPYFDTEEKILQWVHAKGVIIYSDRQEKFRSIMNLNGDSDPTKAFEFCRSTAFVPYLFKGAVYLCSRPVVIGYFNREYGLNIPCSGFIEIHDKDVNGWDVLISISKPCETCKYCITQKNKFKWKTSELSMSDWGIS